MKAGKIQLNNEGYPLTPTLSRRARENFAPSFSGLHVSPKTLKETHFTKQELLGDFDIKRAADKFEVLCTTGKKKYKFRHFGITFDEFNSIIGKIFKKAAILGTAVGGTISLLPDAILSQLPYSQIGLPSYCVLVGLISSSLYASVSSYKQSYKKIPELKIQVGQNIDIKDNDIDNATLKGHTSDIEITMRKVGVDGNVKSRPCDGIISAANSNIIIKEEKDFKEVLSYFDTDDLFDAKNYLKLLQKLKEKCPNDKHIFEHKIDNIGNTMLTQFFDVPLTDKNSKTYDEILDILSKEKNLDFNQKGYMGISILEKIMLAENEKALDFASKYTMFNYTPELNDIYVNIQNKDFKEKVKKLNFKYQDLENALRAKSGKALDKILPYIEESELLDRTAIQSQTEWIMDELVNDRDFEVFMCKNYPQLIYDTPTGKKWREGKKNEN